MSDCSWRIGTGNESLFRWTKFSASIGSSSSTRDGPAGSDTLARELQKELRRVGCYDGEITGVWSSDARRAMKAFIERMNA